MSSAKEEIPAGLRKIFSKKDFDPVKFVRNEGKNIQDINKLINVLNCLAEQTSTAMKQSVYENYSVFIEAAKDVAVLESDMHQMHHLLNEQKRLLQCLQERSIFGNSSHYPDSETATTPVIYEPQKLENVPTIEEEEKKNSRKNLRSLLESTEGAIFIADVPDRRMEFESDLTELNPENFNNIHRVHAFLLNDSLVIAKHLPQRRGPLRYRFDQIYELSSLAVVDCKARRAPPNAKAAASRSPKVQARPVEATAGAGDEEVMRGLSFMLMRFPDTRVLAADTAKLKRRWMEELERTKRRRATEDSKKRESTLILNPPNFSESASSSLTLADLTSEPSGNGGDSSEAADRSLAGPAAALWLDERLEDLDVAIAEHSFGRAVQQIEELRARITESGPGAAAGNARSRLEARVTQLTELLVAQLQPPENVGGVSGPTLRIRASVRSACRQLVSLGRWALACPLLLRYRSAWIAAHLDSVRQEGSQLLYVKKLCPVFFHTLLNSTKEYEHLFQNFPATYTAFCRWCQLEVTQFATSRLRPVLLDNRAVPFHVMCQAMQVARKHAEMYASADGASGMGVDLVFCLEEALLDSWMAAIREQSRVLQEAVEHRHGAGSGERWRPVSLRSEKDRTAFLAQMGGAGLATLVAARLGPQGRLSLAEHTCQFARSLSQLAGGLGQLGSRELAPIGATALAAVMCAEAKHYKRCLAAEQYFEKPSDIDEEQRPFIIENLKFLIDEVLPIVEERIQPGTANLPVYKTAKVEWLTILERSQGVSV